MMKHKIWPLTLGFIGLVTVSTAAFSAESERTLTSSYIVSSDTEIHLDATVGTVELSVTEGDTVGIELRVESDDDGWFVSGGELDKVIIKGERDGNRLEISATPDDDMSQHWIVSVPRSRLLEIDLGVGQIEGDVPFNDLKVDLGVGDVSLNLAKGDYKQVEASVGVGDTSLKNFGNTQEDRMIVTSESSYQGNGSVRVKVEVGVGDVTLKQGY
ncbi:hypothetical protein V6D52_01860 [Idiomarina loihiensis]|uniref:Secreted protein containing internal repeats n=1 Tax=Idiomarina loihiensis (strain ATCC BAA-735 / DSM 15497 / L2-TR) TaxID=283942 RepID=Q5QW33_IDILO|nr:MULTISPECIES: hypothetical protein [Idiomarina]AAV81724.1 Secreted protein containing internal repeats [Idiomarina loihiensis L2TR]AGM35753.1 hypothetical protein K734_04440 [Idiomarina loihiensis GSL 199]MBL4855486.1 hypothetical protein [Idiomarina sp.]MRJ43655.1 hypothetical protein [Idiomarina loihiensis]PHQ89996.1 MAG: hypothetical protein COB44_07255 [Idiomarina sp.]